MDIVVYQNSPTPGFRDGVPLSEGTDLFPVWAGPLIGSRNQEMIIKLAVRCSPDYQTLGNTFIKLIGDTANKWALASDNNGNPGQWLGYGETLTIKETISDTNKIFWLKAYATQDEMEKIDRTVDLRVEANLTE